MIRSEHARRQFFRRHVAGRQIGIFMYHAGPLAALIEGPKVDVHRFRRH